MGNKPPAAVGERISKGERHDLGAAALLPTRAPSLEQAKAGGPMESSPKLVERFETGLTRFAKKAIHRLDCCSGAFRVLASLLVYWHVCLYGKTWLPSILV